MDIFLLYLFTRLDPISAVVGTIAIVACMAFVVSSMFFCFTAEDGYDANVHKGASKVLKIATPVVIVSVLFSVLLPSQKDAALILAGYGVAQVAKSETAGRLASKSVQLIEQTLDGYLNPKKAEK